MPIRHWRLVASDGTTYQFLTYGRLMDKINSRTLLLGIYRIEHWENGRWRYLNSYEHRL